MWSGMCRITVASGNLQGENNFSENHKNQQRQASSKFEDGMREALDDEKKSNRRLIESPEFKPVVFFYSLLCWRRFRRRKPTVDAELVWHTKVFGRSKRAENKRNPPVKIDERCPKFAERVFCIKRCSNQPRTCWLTHQPRQCAVSRAFSKLLKHFRGDRKRLEVLRRCEGSSWLGFRQFKRLAQFRWPFLGTIRLLKCAARLIDMETCACRFLLDFECKSFFRSEIPAST